MTKSLKQWIVTGTVLTLACVTAFFVFESFAQFHDDFRSEVASCEGKYVAHCQVLSKFTWTNLQEQKHVALETLGKDSCVLKTEYLDGNYYLLIEHGVVIGLIPHHEAMVEVNRLGARRNR